MCVLLVMLSYPCYSRWHLFDNQCCCILEYPKLRLSFCHSHNLAIYNSDFCKTFSPHYFMTFEINFNIVSLRNSLPILTMPIESFNFGLII